MQEFIRQLKFYSHSDFSFLEVHNKELFLQNGEVLKAVVKLFEKLKLTQNKTNQLLGNLFELFLQKGMKQDEGQFFTPMPICEFIIHSLPLETMLEKGTPKVIDYACGAGHFLNTYANILTQILSNDEQKQERLDELFSHIYGIEKEYRLSKVAKVAAAMFSQEKINITYADALDFAKFTHKDFDLLISNPPYSVKGFANTLNKSAYAKFELKDKVSDLDSFNAIECFFIERANSLLASNAKLAIVLPSSILHKGGIYESTREIILRNFDIIAIVELGSATFGATGTNTIILFANKRETYANSQDSQSYLNLKDNIEESLSFDNVYLNAFLREYCEFMGYNQADFGEFLNGKINTTLAKTPEFSEYEKAFLASSEYANLLKSKAYKDAQNQAGKDALKQATFLKFALEIEKDKLLHFALNHKTEVLIVKSPSDLKEQKKFLGYEWSNKKGNEGLKELHNPYQSQLFDRENPHNETKINVLIKNAFLNNTNQIPQELEKHAIKARLVEMLDFSGAEFNKAITLNLSKGAKSANPFENSKFELVRLGEFEIKIQTAKRPEGGVGRYESGALSLGGEHIDNVSGCVRLNSLKFVPMEFYEEFKRQDKGIVKENDILICKDGALTGKIALVRDEFKHQIAMINEHIFLLRCNDLTKQKFLFYILYSQDGQNLLKSKITGSAQGGLNKTNLESIQIPKPPLEIQKQIVAECEEIEKQYQTIRMSIDEYKKLIKAILIKCGICENDNNNAGGGGLVNEILNTLLEFQNTFEALSLNFKFDLNALQKDLNALPHPPQQGWEKAKLGDYINSSGGNGFPKEYQGNKDNSQMPFIKVSDMNLIENEREIIISNNYVTQEIIDELSLKIFPKNTIVFPKVGMAIHTNKKRILNNPCIIDNNIMGVNVLYNKTDKLNYKFLFIVFNFYIDLRDIASKANPPSINNTNLNSLKIPLPPLKEQEKISSCIEKLETQISHLNSMLLNLETQKTHIIERHLF